MPVFLHEKLDVYFKALHLVCLIDALVARLPKERDYIVFQLRRAAASIVANLAEGTAGQSKLVRLNYFRIARGSAAECSAWFDIIARLRLLPQEELPRTLVLEVGAMLGGLCATKPTG